MKSNVFRAGYIVTVSALNLPEEILYNLKHYLQVENDTFHNWNTEDEWFKYTSEINQYLNEAGVPSDGQIIFYFSW